MKTLEKLLALAENCRLCPRQCGVNRLKNEKGFCLAGNELTVSYTGPHHGEEPPISGTQGSGTIFLGHCTMACVFCQNWQISQAHTTLKTISPEDLAQEMLRLQKSGMHNINFVSPSQYAPWIYQAWKIAKQNGLSLPIVYNTNGYEHIEVLELLDEMIDIYLPDRKYTNNTPAEKYSGAPNYAEHNLAALKHMLNQKGLLQMDKNDIAVQGVIVRHLVLPDLSADSKKILTELYDLNPNLHVSLMSQYAPHHKAAGVSELSRKLSAPEYNETVAHAELLGMENVWVQELESQEIFAPDFREEQPFNG